MMSRVTNSRYSIICRNSGVLAAIMFLVCVKPLPAQFNFNDIKFVNDSTGYVIGWPGVFLKTTDYGDTWHQQYNYTVRFVQSSFISEQLVYLHCKGDFLESFLWKCNNLATGTPFYVGGPWVDADDFLFIDDSIGFWCIGGSLYRTVDGGLSETNVISTSSDRLDIEQVNDSLLIFLGSNGDLYKSLDHGQTWLLITNSQSLKKVSFLNESIVWGADGSNNLLYSEDGGASWVVKSAEANLPSISQIHPINETSVYLISGTTFFASYDIGDTWSETPIGDNMWYRQSLFLSASTGFYIGESSTINLSPDQIIVTRDSGLTWSSPTFVGFGISSVFDEARPSDPLVIRVSPNPFNGSVKIQYSLQVYSDVSISVFNLRGEQVFFTSADSKEAGNYTFIWMAVDIDNRPVESGMYIVCVNDGKNIVAKKMLLVK